MIDKLSVHKEKALFVNFNSCFKRNVQAINFNLFGCLLTIHGQPLNTDNNALLSLFNPVPFLCLPDWDQFSSTRRLLDHPG